MGTTGTTSGTSSRTNSAGTVPPNQSTATAGGASAAIPGVQANCGPLHLELGPIDETQSTLSFHLDRLVVDVAAPEGMVSSASTLMCSADAALSQAAGVSASGATNTPAFTPSFGGTSGTLPTSNAASNTATTPLQSFVAVLNQLVGAF
jgi:hypothetical protein